MLLHWRVEPFFAYLQSQVDTNPDLNLHVPSVQGIKPKVTRQVWSDPRFEMG